MSSRFKRRSNDVLGSKYSGSGSILQLPDYLTEQAGRGCVGTSMELGRRRGVLCVLSLIYILWCRCSLGTELIRFLAVLAILHQDDLNKGINSSYSSYRPGAVHPILFIGLVQFILFLLSSWCKIASAPRNRINSVQAAAMTFAVSIS